MNIDPRQPHAPEPLDAHERELAQRLARLGPHGEPSPGLDARILAAAHAATTTSARPRARRHWPLALGVAASLTLAIGLTWRLRPLPEAAPAWNEAAAVMSAAREATDAAQADAAMQERRPEPTAGPAVAPPEPRREAADSAARPMTADPGSARDTAMPPLPAAAEPAPQATARSIPAPTAPAPMRVPAPPPAPPAPPPVVFDEPAAPAAFPATPASKQRAAAPAADANGYRAGAAAATAESAMAADASTGQDADDAQARLDWLQRVRALRDAGRVDDASAQLRAFRQRWPDYPLPDDLQRMGR